MALAVWIVCAWVFVVFFGTWAVQIAVFLALVVWRLLVLLAGLVWGIISLGILAVIDRHALMRILRNRDVHAEIRCTRAIERWS